MHQNQFTTTISKPLLYRLFLVIFILQSFNIQAQKHMITPPKLQKGDTVAILATARKNLDDNLKPAIDLLKSWGLNVVIGSTIGLDNNQLAGTDEQRAADFQQQMDNPNIKMIWCVKGGYGTVRIIDLLDFTKFKKHPKWLVGFSDVTALHNHLNTMGYKSIHGIMPVTVARATPQAVETLRIALFGEKLKYEVEPIAMNRLGKAKGELVGGNLSILYSLFGSPSAIDCTDKILFIEDLDEYLYHIDRMMMNLKRNGLLKNLNALIVGGMTDMHDNQVPFGKNASQIIHDVCGEYSFPIIENFPAGHIKDNQAIIFNKEVEIQIDTEKIKVQF